MCGAQAQLCPGRPVVPAVKRIASRDNPGFKALRKLFRSSRERNKTARIVLDGMHLVESYWRQFGRPEEVLVSESGLARAEIRSFLEGRDAAAAVSVLSDALFEDLATVDAPSGIMAVARYPEPARGPDAEADAVLLDGIQDAGNLGSILRTAAAAGFRQILLSGDCAQAWSPKTLRAAMGAHFLLDLHENCDLAAFLRTYRGMSVVTALDAAADYHALDLTPPLAWIFGNEGQGVRPEIASLAKQRARIAMPGATESLNVGAAAAICLFETVRQRQKSRESGLSCAGSP